MKINLRILFKYYNNTGIIITYNIKGIINHQNGIRNPQVGVIVPEQKLTVQKVDK